MAGKFFENLSDNYLKLLNDEEDFNVVINVGESPNTKTFRAHSTILKYRSLYFNNKLANTSKDENSIKIINLNHISIQQFEIIIRYIYGGVLTLEKLDASLIFELMLIAYELLFDELTKFLESYLIETNASWLRLNFTRIYEKCFQNNKFLELQKWCNNIVTKYPNKVFDSESFTSLQENALISLIGRDDLQMEEVKIWNYVIKWGLAQDPNLPFDLNNWTKENFLSLNTILKNCLPLIRYFQMSNDDIIEHVQPYHQILGKNLWDDILKKLNTPNQIISTTILPPRVILIQNLPHRVSAPFSTVINEDHAAEIASWVDKKADTYSTSNNPYEFKLLFRGSRDGFTANSFWNLCDKQTNVVVVIEVKETNEILGGYNPIGWDKPTKSRIYKNCDKCFIFSLKNDSIKNSILSRISDRGQNKAIACCSKYGPSFRNGLYIKDRCDETDRCYCWYDSKDTYYEKIRDTSLYIHDIGFIYGYKSGFSVNDYEVFQIYKKNI